MKPYGQKRVYGKYITRTYRAYGKAKIHITTLIKNKKLGRRWRKSDDN